MPELSPPWLFSPRTELRAAVSAGVLLAFGAALQTWFRLPAAAALIWTSLAIGLLYGGKAAWEALREGKFDIDVLMVIGAVLAASIGHAEEGALLLFLFVLSGALEDRAMQRTRREVEALHALMPAGALVQRGGEWVEAGADTLRPGERIKVRPGERVPADARVEQGESTFDQSAITGESMPRSVAPGDELFAGTINTDDPIEAIVLRPAGESSLQRILDLVTKARESREPVQRLIDRLSGPYSIGVMILSLAVLLIWWRVLGVPLLGSAEQKGALYTAITLLIVASPCALIISTPTATLSAIARAARGGVLFKGGASIERLARVGAVCFDKTGTLTYGRPRLHEVHAVAWSDADELLAVAAALEADSTHPIANAVREAAQARGITPAPIGPVNHTVARGLEAEYKGRTVRLGSYPFVEASIPVCFRARVRELLAGTQTRGHVGVTIADGEQCAVLMMADPVRPGAAELVRDLHALGVRPVRMLTGDNRLTAAKVAADLGLDAFDADMLPSDKLTAVATQREAMKGRPRPGVAVIGDGVNDAPALAAADASLAIGTIGTAAAMESADAVLLGEHLGAVPWAVGLARRTRRTITTNIGLSLLVMAGMAAMTLIGSRTGRDVPLSVGVLAHEGGTLLVVLNSLLLLGYGKMKSNTVTTAPATTGRPDR
ncbi:MAG: cation-translocating P-type ATPase [Phycisphaerae bacterium]|nr:cation-translocating P-type ATPase [Phycisphaerae bacterium]